VFAQALGRCVFQLSLLYVQINFTNMVWVPLRKQRAAMPINFQVPWEQKYATICQQIAKCRAGRLMVMC
jgi:hypothetical protein